MIGLRRRLVGALSALLIAGPGQPAFAAGRDLVVFAAASLKNALDDALELWQQNGSAPVVVSYAGSSTLARQLSMGAPADLFISADEAWMQVLRDERRLQAGSERLLLGNRLALIATTGAAVPADLLPPRPGMPLRAALGEAGRFALADPRHVPAGRYARAALEHLQVWAAVQERLAPMNNVRLALALVARGEAPLGIVYATDAGAEPRVRVLALLAETLHPPIRYPAAVMADSRHPAAPALLDFLGSAAARERFARHGFLVPG